MHSQIIGSHATYDDDGKFISGPEIKYELKEDIFKIDKDFNLLNMLSSRIKSSDFEKCMTNVWRIATYYQRSGVSYHNPTQTSLSGTPLNEDLLSVFIKLFHSFKSPINFKRFSVSFSLMVKHTN